MNYPPKGIKASDDVSAPVEAPKKFVPKNKRCKWKACNKVFKQVNAEHVFCSKQCRYNFHNFGDAYGTLEKRGLERLLKTAKATIDKEMPRLMKRYNGALLARIEKLEAQLKELQRTHDNVNRALAGHVGEYKAHE